ncbi:uncharacterized protein LOC128734874 isoform X3 [Sabethes cyaneus]|uniref:uncharacterized protein LOC128734874 isoform X3 n=1 Tax=Sabethes cyaneus TaxID=53552 RepID=UPI00237DEB03|nr:uncharacterized protein LOC128734874 isoform X3 [Sabethes cyaneus]XP_053685240.1 uncharacterized protein LOC128734874 isoform X3 [Sabethes cyaneus]
MISHKLYKVLCYLTAALNILLVIEIIYDVVIPVRSRVAADMILSPCMANIVLAVLLIVGIAKHMPSFIKVFRIFMYVQMAFLLLIAIYIYRLVVHGKEELRPAAHGAVMLIALFGLEAIIASGGLHAVLSEPRFLPEGSVTFQSLA